MNRTDLAAFHALLVFVNELWDTVCFREVKVPEAKQKENRVSVELVTDTLYTASKYVQVNGAATVSAGSPKHLNNQVQLLILADLDLLIASIPNLWTVFLILMHVKPGCVVNVLWN